MTPDEEIDHTPLDFGMYKGSTPSEVAEHDPGYIVWMRRVIGPHICSEALARDCENDLREGDAERYDHDDYLRQL